MSLGEPVEVDGSSEGIDDWVSSMATGNGPAGVDCWQDASSSPVAKANAVCRTVPILMSPLYAGQGVVDVRW